MHKNFLSTLGLCRKARKAEIGFMDVSSAIKSNRIFAAFAAEDISPKTLKELNYVAREKDVTVSVIPVSMNELSRAIGIKAGIVGISDKGFAETLIKYMEE